MDERWTYLLIDLASISLPLIFSFHPRIQYHKEWPYLLPAMLLGLIVFILWDVGYTHLGVWGFNERYISGIHIINLPIEEWLFFICIPYASLFIDHLMRNQKYSHQTYQTIRRICQILGGLLILTALLSWGNLYTMSAFLLCAVLLLNYSRIRIFHQSPNFMIAYLVILVPFFIVNGLLTGSWIEEQVVWYDPAEFMGYRMGTIPVEDLFYGLALLLLIKLVYHKLKRVAITGNP